ncbi:MAG: LysM peptidoglycan-binding domain-containing protein [Bacteroidales bacterium]|nr:LysM peptidoglycan-binding domain-containing protein [Bacteroidales bacterium]
MFRISPLIIVSFLLIKTLSAQEDTTIVYTNNVNNTTESGFLSNLDSMMNLWYVKEAETKKYLERPPRNRDTNFVPIFSDSVYLQRISSMNSVINLTYNTKVQSYINLYAHKKRPQLEIMLGLSEYYFPMFEQILDEEGVPKELKYLSIIESALYPRARSKANAVGLWQFMYYTGKIYGLQADSYVDDRRDPIKSTKAAARFLKDLYTTFDDWVLALAAYNCGPGNVRKAIKRSGGKTDYWEIYNHLPAETRGYVPAFIAASYVMQYHSEHNLYPRNIDMPLKIDTVMVTEKVHLKQIAEVMNIPVEQLRDLNPQFLIDIVPANSEKPYHIILPANSTISFIALQDSIYNYKDSIFFNPATITKAPAAYTGYVAQAPKDKKKLIYTVKSGDNLGFIAEWYEVSLQDLRYWNGINGNVIKIGQNLVIYKSQSVAGNYANINNYTFEQKNKSIGKNVSSSSPSTTTETKQTTTPTKNTESKSISKVPSGNAQFVYHTVKSGDTLWGIAKQYPGVSDRDIMALNNLSNADKIKIGMKLKIKQK